MKLKCAACPAVFEAKRKNARFCSAKCRQRGHRDAGIKAKAPSRNGKVITIVPPRGDTTPAAAEGAPDEAVAATVEVPTASLIAVTVAALLEVGRLDTPLGTAAYFAAQRLENSHMDTASSIASLLKQYRETFAEAVKDAQVEDDAVEDARKRALALVVGGDR